MLVIYDKTHWRRHAFQDTAGADLIVLFFGPGEEPSVVWTGDWGDSNDLFTAIEQDKVLSAPNFKTSIAGWEIKSTLARLVRGGLRKAMSSPDLVPIPRWMRQRVGDYSPTPSLIDFSRMYTQCEIYAAPLVKAPAAEDFVRNEDGSVITDDVDLICKTVMLAGDYAT